MKDLFKEIKFCRKFRRYLIDTGTNSDMNEVIRIWKTYYIWK